MFFWSKQRDKVQGFSISPFSGCKKAAGKLRQKWSATTVTKFTKAGNDLIESPCTFDPNEKSPVQTMLISSLFNRKGGHALHLCCMRAGADCRWVTGAGSNTGATDADSVNCILRAGASDSSAFFCQILGILAGPTCPTYEFRKRERSTAASAGKFSVNGRS